MPKQEMLAIEFTAMTPDGTAPRREVASVHAHGSLRAVVHDVSAIAKLDGCGVLSQVRRGHTNIEVGVTSHTSDWSFPPDLPWSRP